MRAREMVGHEVEVRRTVHFGTPASLEWRGRIGVAVDAIDTSDEVRVLFGDEGRWFYVEQIRVTPFTSLAPKEKP